MKSNPMNLAGLVIATIFCFALTVLPAVEDGQRRFRWGQDDQLETLATRLTSFPTEFGDWKATTSFELDSNAQGQLEPIAYIDRIYFSAAKQKQFHVFLLLGPTGPTAAHTADICFSSRDYRQLGERAAVNLTVDSRQSSLFESLFVSRNVDGHYLRTWYGWTVDGTWQASEQPRFSFAQSRYLFKLQVVSRYATRKDMEQDTDFEAFVKELENAIQFQLY